MSEPIAHCSLIAELSGTATAWDRGSIDSSDRLVSCCWQASVMSGSGGEFGAVACLPHTQNPIVVAQSAWQQRRRGRLSLDRVPPMSVECVHRARAIASASERGTSAHAFSFCFVSRLLAGPAALDFAVAHAPLSHPHPDAPCARAAAGEGAIAVASSSPDASAAAAQASCCPLVTDETRRKWLRYSSSIAEEDERLKSAHAAAAGNIAASSTASAASQPAASASSTGSGDLAADVSWLAAHASRAMAIFGHPSHSFCVPVHAALLSQQLSTVGAIVVSLSGEVFAGVSSGGIWMKSSGRVGHVSHSILHKDESA